uniref:CPG4 domain-containing protein n=1 Tax=Strongyloides venezuelensis TaxID=75913 RepID=A0A0K0EZ21_STRVS
MINDDCVGSCALSFISSMENQLGPNKSLGLLQLNFNDFLIAFSNQTFHQQFCKLYHTFQYCYQQCNHNFLLELLTRSSEIIDHFCLYNYQAIQNKFPCLNKLNQETSKQCLKGCTSKHKAVTSMMQNFKHLAMNGDSSQAEKYLSEGCEYVTCSLHCDIPAIAHFCDYETAHLVINITRKSFNSMQKVALDTGAISKWPSSCLDLKTYSLPTPLPPQLPTTTTVLAPTIKINEVQTKVQEPTLKNQSSPTQSLFISYLIALIFIILILKI